MSQGLSFSDFKIRRGTFQIQVQDFKIGQKERVGLRAPSGFGKTSVVRAVLGLDSHEGEVRLDGQSLTAVPVHRRKIGVVFQDQVLFTHMNAIENAMSGLLLQGWKRAEAEKTAKRGLEFFEIADRALARVGELSGGERQRVALLRATLWAPKLLILDEPFQGLDERSRQLVFDYLSQIMVESPVPMIWIDHQAEFSGLQLIGEQQHDQSGIEQRIFKASR
jgi:ABC-type Fe3+/spermidine/putrescine transport system ATPase subunit